MDDKINTPMSKRQRNEEENIVLEDEEVLKRQKSYKDIITLLEEEDESVVDLSSLISTLQEEIILPGPTSLAPDETDPENLQSCVAGSSGSESEEGERVMRHLLEASDDELGIPNMDGYDEVGDGHVEGGDLATLPFGDGLWEFEDHEANNYYNNMLQHENFFVV